MTAIPAPIRELPVFAGHQHLSCEPLPEGRTNRNYRVIAGGSHHFVRLSVPDPSSHSIDRACEYASICEFHRAGLGPRPVYFCERSQTIVTEFIDAPNWVLEKVRRPDSLAAFADAFSRMHRLPDNGATYDIAAVAGQYLEGLRNAQVASREDMQFLVRLHVWQLVELTVIFCAGTESHIMPTITITADLIPEDEGGFPVYCPELDIYTQGETEGECLSNLREAAEMHLAELGDATNIRKVARRELEVPIGAQGRGHGAAACPRA